MRPVSPVIIVVFTAALSVTETVAQEPARTLVAVFAHEDDETSVGPILARYAREGAQVYLIVATDGAEGRAHTSILPGPELARVRAEEGRCATGELGIHPPILLGFPDAKLGDYLDDRARLFRLTERVHEELQRLHADALITWGPDGGTGHPDHRIVSNIVTQLVRSGAPGVPERVFYASLPSAGFKMMNPTRGEPRYLIPLEKYFTVRIAFAETDFERARRAMSCHRTQYSDEIVQRIFEATRPVWNGIIPLMPLFPATAGTDLLAPK
jgi:LmbE family N-acetylglucosaminyl deacetylase